MKPHLRKRILNNAALLTMLIWLAAAYIRLVWVTARVTEEFDPAAEPYFSGEKQVIFAFWHGRMLLLPACCPRKRKAFVLISGHRDGRMISRVIAHFGIGTVEGSSSKNSLSGLRNALRILKEGNNLSITPDGPRGPCHVAAPGVAHLARVSGVPVVPVALSCSRYRRLKSWDRFMIPYPFSRVIFIAGAPIMIDREANTETMRQRIESVMNSLTAQADELAGVVS